MLTASRFALRRLFDRIQKLTATSRVRGPVFVAGCPRSGTSALGWAIAASPRYWTSVETHFFFGLLGDGGRNRVHDVFEACRLEGSWLDTHEVPYCEFLSSIGSGLNSLMLSRSNHLQWLDNSPENLLVADDLLMMFPEAVVIHVIRDPREVCASMMLSGFEREAWSYDIDEAIATWKYYMETGQSLRARHPDRVMEVMHARMLQDPDALASEISKFLTLKNARPIAQFLRTECVNSSYDASSKLTHPGGKSISASRQQRETFLNEKADYILSHSQPYADDFGFGESRSLPRAPDLRRERKMAFS